MISTYHNGTTRGTARTLGSLLTTTLLLSGCADQPTVASTQAPSHIVVPVAYATTRNISSNSEQPHRRYGGSWSPLSYGVASVALSTRRKANSRHADWTRWPALPGKLTKNRQLLEAQPLDKRTFYQHLATNSGDEPTERSLLVYVHGYAQTFRHTATAAALLAYRLNFEGTVVLYSWPSLGSPLAYAYDVNNVHRSADQLRDFLAELADDQRFERVHIVAHSLGSQGLIKALSGWLDPTADASHAERKLGHIAFIAPDLDARRFRTQTANWLRTMGQGITLYVSQFDIPLLASAFINQGRRVGDASAGALIEPGIDTIDSTPATNPFAAHLVHLNNAEVVSDLHYLFNEQMTAAQRPTVLAVNTASGRYWQARTAVAEKARFTVPSNAGRTGTRRR